MTLSLRPSSIAASPDDQLVTLSAQVRDPLWLLARQWQTGEFIASDGGTPVQVSLTYTSAAFTLAGTVQYGPLEPVIEAEPPPTVDSLDTRSRVRLASELVRSLADAGLSRAQVHAIRAALARDYPLRPVEPGSPLQSFADRLPDIAALHEKLAALGPDGSGEPFPPLPAIDGLGATSAPAARAAIRGWYARTAAQFAGHSGTSARREPASWDPRHLEYAFTLTAVAPDGPTSLVGGGDVTLRATGYDGSGLDWYAFDRDRANGGQPAQPEPTVTIRPTPVSYPGMPRPRFWELEDGNVNLDALRPANPTAESNPAHAVLATFAHQYANDWFLLPLEVPSGVCTITSLQITDTFGTTTPVPAVASIDPVDGPWHLWDLTPTGERVDSITGSNTEPGTGARVFLPPSPPPIEGPVLEEVLLARDEMANVAWVIELATADQDGAPIDRQQRWLRLRTAADPAYHPAAGPADTYRLGTTIPDFWYPLVATTDQETPLLVLAKVPLEAGAEARGVSDEGVQGHLIDHSAASTIADEEVPREGALLARRDRLTLGPAGPVAWRARTKTAGRGESSSGLRFDVLE